LLHFTYQPPDGHLQQGDVLVRTPELQAVLEQVHPHFANKVDYGYLMVLTQSCDLVVRGGRCKGRYVTLAATRPLDVAIRRQLGRHQRSPREGRLGYCALSQRPYMRQFIERLLNNNEPGLFYLHRELQTGLKEPRVALLRVSAALKSELHYKVCLSARIAQLRPQFQSKLGWLVGNIYSRVGTEDWIPTAASKEDFGEMVSELLNQYVGIWVEDGDMKKVSKAEKALKREHGGEYEMTKDELISTVERLQAERRARPQKAAERAAQVLCEVDPALRDNETARKLRDRLKSDRAFRSLLS